MGESAEDDSRKAQDSVDEVICAATFEVFRAAAPALVLERTLRGPSPEPPALTARVRLSGSGGSGVLELGCEARLAPVHGEHAVWVVERAQALGHRVEKRLRQFGVAVRLDATSEQMPALPMTPFRSTYLFGAGGARVLVHFDGELDAGRLVGAGEVPLRDEGDIILF